MKGYIKLAGQMIGISGILCYHAVAYLYHDSRTERLYRKWKRLTLINPRGMSIATKWYRHIKIRDRHWLAGQTYCDMLALDMDI
jgi:hypothetical protein